MIPSSSNYDPNILSSIVKQLVDAVNLLTPAQAGLYASNNGQIVTRSLVPDTGIEIDNPLGVTGDPVIRASQGGKLLLGSLIGADLNSTADQIIQIPEFNKYIITDILVTNASTTPSTSAGGVYTAPSKAGYTLVAAAQTYSALSDSGLVLALTIAVSRMLTGPDLYFSLTTGHGSACTADIYVMGHWFKG